MLNLLGRGYAVDHCVSSFSKSQEEKAYKYYVTNLLWRADRVHYTDDLPRYCDIADEISGKKKRDTRSAEEIKDDLQTRINALSKGGADGSDSI